MNLNRRTILSGASGAALLAGVPGGSALAQSVTRAETLRYVTGDTINTLDPTMPGRPASRSACP